MLDEINLVSSRMRAQRVAGGVLDGVSKARQDVTCFPDDVATSRGHDLVLTRSEN